MTSRSARVLRGLGALAVLLVGLVGAPLALAALGGNPLPTAITWESFRRALFAPDDGGILLGLVYPRGLARLAGLPGLGAERAGHPAVAAADPGQPARAGRTPAGRRRPAALGDRHGGRSGGPDDTGSARADGARPTGGPRAPAAAASRPRNPWPSRAAPRTSASTWCNPATICGASPSATTTRAANGAGSRRPTRTYSPVGPTGCRSDGGWSFRRTDRAPRRSAIAP